MNNYKSIVFMLAINIVITFIDPKIDILGHVGGFIGGILFGFMISK